MQNGEPHHPGAPGPSSGRAGGGRAQGEGDGAADPPQHHQREEGDRMGPCPEAGLDSAGKKYLNPDPKHIFQFRIGSGHWNTG